MIAKSGGEVVGFVSGYRLPARPEVLFIWQIVVAAQARGQGLAGRMLQAQLDAEACSTVRFIETTITEDNAASRSLFRSFAEQRGAAMTELPGFDRERHFGGGHDSEHLIRVDLFPNP